MGVQFIHDSWVELVVLFDSTTVLSFGCVIGMDDDIHITIDGNSVVIFRHNYAENGGGVFCLPSYANVTFTDNSVVMFNKTLPIIMEVFFYRK